MVRHHLHLDVFSNSKVYVIMPVRLYILLYLNFFLLYCYKKLEAMNNKIEFIKMLGNNKQHQ